MRPPNQHQRRVLLLLRLQDPSVAKQGTRLPVHPDAVLAQDPPGDLDDFGIHSMCSDQASSAYPAAKTPGSSSRAEGYGSPRDKAPRIQVPGSSPRAEGYGYGSPKDKTPRIQVPIPTDKLTKKSEPFAVPRLAPDPRLRESSQHLETEHLIRKMLSAVRRLSVVFTWY